MIVIFTMQSVYLLVQLQLVILIFVILSAYRGGEVQFIDRRISNRTYESRHLLQIFIFLPIYRRRQILCYIHTCFCLVNVLSTDSLLVIFVGHIFKFSHSVHVCNYCDLYKKIHELYPKVSYFLI